jgi:hypothetical protein
MFQKCTSLLLVVLLSYTQLLAQHNAGNNGRILMIASNKSTSKQTGWPIGFSPKRVIV